MDNLDSFRRSRRQFLARGVSFKKRPSTRLVRPELTAFTDEMKALRSFADSAKDEASLIKPFKAVWNDSYMLSDAVKAVYPDSELDVDDAALDDMVEIADGRDMAQAAQYLNDDPEEYSSPGMPGDLASQPDDIFVMPNGVDSVHHLDTDDVDEYVEAGLNAIHDFKDQAAEWND